MAVDELDPRVLGWRVKQVETRQETHIKESDEWRREVDDERSSTREQMKFMRNDIQTLTTGFQGLRRALIGFALTIAGSCVVFALSVLIATGKL